MSQIFCFLAVVYCLMADLRAMSIVHQPTHHHHHHHQAEPRLGPASSVPELIINKRIIPKITPKPTKTKNVLPQTSDICSQWSLTAPL